MNCSLSKRNDICMEATSAAITSSVVTGYKNEIGKIVPVIMSNGEKSRFLDFCNSYKETCGNIACKHYNEEVQNG